MSKYSPYIDSQHKWKLLQEMPARDSKNEHIKHMAALIWELSGHSQGRFIKLAFSVAKDGIHFESDIKQFKHEDIAGVTRNPEPNDSIDAYIRGHDDCDAKARLFVALCLASGFEARLWPLWKGPDLVHVAGEVRLNGDWIHAETILARAVLGEMHEQVPKEPTTGKWKMA